MPQLSRRRTLSLIGLVIIGGASIAAWRTDQSPQPSAAKAELRQIIARGRIEPSSRVRAVHGIADGSIIDRLLVDQGDTVSAGQVLAILDSHDIRRAELLSAERSLRLAELEQTQVKAGAKTSEVAAQRDAKSAKEAQLRRLHVEWDRRTALYHSDVVSKQSLDTLRAELDQTESEVAQAGNTLKSLTETRSIDEQVAAARTDVERAAVEKARANLEHTLIRAPDSGTILSIQARAGEALGTDGLLRMADLTNILVVAEVEETLAPRLHEGMTATIEAPMLDHPLTGKVVRLSHEIFRQKRPSSDILIGRDARIAEVEVSTDQPLPQVLGAEMLVRFNAGGQ